DENVSYSLSSDAGTLIVSRRRGTFGTPMPQLQLLPKHVGERRWTWSAGQPGGGRLHGFSTEQVSFFHQGNLDAVKAWSIPYWFWRCYRARGCSFGGDGQRWARACARSVVMICEPRQTGVRNAARLANTATRPLHNPPMQRTGAAGMISLIRTVPERGSGR